MKKLHNITKENIDSYLVKLGKEFRHLNGKQTPAEIIIVGGGSVIINYGFRESTMDIDAIIQASSAMKEAILKVADKEGLPANWLNDDFTKTTSYSNNLITHSKYYRTFSNILEVRTISSEYLLAMKLKSFRDYKKDKSDIIGIIINDKNILTLDVILNAIKELYGNANSVSDSAYKFLNEVLSSSKDLKNLFDSTIVSEENNYEILNNFNIEYPHILNDDNLQNILDILKNKK